MNRAALVRVVVVAGTLLAAACSKKAPSRTRPEPVDEWTARFLVEFSREPDSTPTRWKNLIGEYGPDTVTRWFVIERDRRLWIQDQFNNFVPLAAVSDSVYSSPVIPVPINGEVRFSLDSTGRATAMRAANVVMERRNVEPPSGASQLRITSVRPLDELMREALAATPPAESGRFVPSDLVDLATLDTTIRFDIRYATDNNFLGAPMYSAPRAFMQKAAAQALVRANRNAKRVGYALLIHDAYRPWYVTKVFWDATPQDKKWMVANPAQGSRHNRGIAVDLTLWDIERKVPVEMPSTYDESSPRAHSTYPGGTSLQRYYRLLLRKVMENEGFAVHPLEWWHFDFVDFKRYAIGNEKFEDLGRK